MAPSVSHLVKEFKLSTNSNVGDAEKKVLENISSANPTTTVSKKTKLEIPDIAEKVGPAVVGVINMTTYSGYSYNNPYGFFFGDGSNQQQQGQEVEQGSGSGIIISEDGYIITNNHVVEGASSLKVILNTGEEFTATLKGSDSRTDLALLKIEGKKFPYATLGDSTALRVGDLAVAIGNPLGQELAGTVTVGYISALNRTMTIDNKQLTLIQTDAAINPGNSGGALVNCYGEVIGINTAKVSSSSLEGLGFAIPTAEAKPIIEDLIANGYVKGRPVIGIAGRAISASDAKRYNLVEGIYVYSMTDNSPAHLAGLKIGDIITECNGQAVKTVDELNEIKNKYKPNDTLKLKVWRTGETLDVNLILGEEVPN
ncbi:MAG: trypsin-like peptidase domain-containing protein [Clostridiales bacterium]|nr:MAG: trypsin-like peptidase domain-containing protein [Clostridiales bacterium]